MLNEALSKRYSAALYSCAKEEGGNQTVAQFKELQAVLHTFEEHEDLKRCFLTPTVSRRAKKEIVKAVFAEHVSQRTLNFLRVLIDKEREVYFEDIVECYTRQLCEDNRIWEVKVEAAEDLDKTLCDLIKDKLEAGLNKNKAAGDQPERVKLKVEIKPELLGGLIIHLGGRLYDGSIRRHLDKMRSLLKNKPE